ncbi:FRG domain-containing protein [Paenibacillus chondroitinus]|uniref:FRG domain-containing protein n=1 Tax=Paenibacillus chondroitinus TaxID=59842 RepID=A0ABU6DKC8_9BACL|nr:MULTISPECIES: FRG domain-containing protein [Paenibacillus]MCY9663365.1 FRG domain-containing protein [Paenibacillus anseongense]MEB4798237.1 FRG domain-containing protein [Paenibacillus chondroitinus]
MLKPTKTVQTLENGIFEISGIDSVEKYLKAVDQIYQMVCPPKQPQACELWFRGVKSTTYNLDPSISRGLGAQSEIVYLSKFRSLAYPYLGNVPYFPYSEDKLHSYWGWLFLMQHYSVPTRLLDWSREALVALLFALGEPTNTLEETTDKAVWLLSPVTLNQTFRFYNYLKPGYIPNVSEPAFTALFGPNAKSDNVKAAAAIGPLNNPRIIKQAGTFTVYPLARKIVPLDLLPDSSKYLYKIIIKKGARESMNNQLLHYGLSEHDLYPGLENVAADIRQEIESEGLKSNQTHVSLKSRTK